MKKVLPNYILRIPAKIYQQAVDDLKRHHSFAFERVGFFSTSISNVGGNKYVVTIVEYYPIEDSAYINDKNAGAVISSETIRQAMQRIIKTKRGCLHVHLHEHNGKPTPSFTDLESLPHVAKSFYNVNSNLCSGYLILSKNSFFGAIATSNINGMSDFEKVTIVGNPLSFSFKSFKTTNDKRNDRQSFLGPELESLLTGVSVGIVGVGGGGSHIAQQLAHIGIKTYVLFDDDHIERSNLNRLIGAWEKDILKKFLKVKIASRLIKNILPSANIISLASRWQGRAEELQQCDIVVGCVDSFSDREQLESECRRFLIPYIDIGMDVLRQPGQAPSIAGQVILSTPGQPCMRCMQFITEEKLSIEAGKYGAVGDRPQVVWPNGVLASTAVGILVDLITGWTSKREQLVYLSYDGNNGLIMNHPRLLYTKKECSHFNLSDTGVKVF